MDSGELVYGSDQEYDNIEASSEPVQGLATSVYKEFERMIAKYDQDVVRDLMPHVVTMLETLDQTITERNESAVEIELLEDDKKQLKTQFERERQQKRQAEQRLIESEDTVEYLNRELKQTGGKLEVTSRQLEMKTKSFSDQMERLLERETELKKEYNELHQRHSEMIRSYVEHIEKTKALQQQQTTPEVSTYSPLPRKKRPETLETISPLSPETPSLKQLESTPTQKSFEEEEEREKFKRLEWTKPIDPFHPNIKQEIAESVRKEEGGSKTDSALSSSKEENHIDIFSDRTSLESGSSGPDSGHLLSHEFQQNVLKLGCPSEVLTTNHVSVVENALMSHKKDDEFGVENEGFDHAIVTNNDSLFAELDGKDLGDVDDGADILGMGKELENLMLENTKLMATKNALDIVKDDLIHQVDQLTNQLSMLQEDLDRAHQAKDSLSRRVSDLENQLKNAEKKSREADISPSSQTSKTPDEDDIVPMSQRKRFTRVEMARVLMERNQYKERLMELQEAVRWTEMLRASRDHPAETEIITRPKAKSKSSFSQFFSRLFGPGAPPTQGNVSPSRKRLQRPTQQMEDIKMRHSKSDSFTPPQSAVGK